MEVTGTTGRTMRAIGLMSGTSMDGIDVALLETDGERVQAFGPRTTLPYAPGLRAALGDLVGDAQRAEHDPAGDLVAALTDAHADAVRGLLAESGVAAADVDVIGFHGHTVLHRPERRLTRQIGDGARLAAATGVDVVCDLRAADVAAGGQGAPLAPLFHRALAAGLVQPLAVLNLGGVGNVTWLDGARVVAFDTGPGNALIDDWVRRHTGEACDRDGRLAAAGTAQARPLQRLLDNGYFGRPPPKSLDRNDFSGDAVFGLSVEDGAATLTAFTVASVARALRHLPAPPKRWLVTGGGRHNPVLMQMLADDLAVPVDPVEAVGWDGDAIEAQAFAFLAVRSLRGLPLSLPSTTGVPAPTTGGVLHRAPR
ncbi:anhydro-N-acetylmuramic acid kinase [Constrictibacter sp. MBR-5]|jgi:anhydro-N-acetylmuramic acid kinase|uniref:anhydro-N-acetylmuramic acid kinase n=1 Tax=Constrictibacter sp. MBR-5 TaxID=3156467 RepID=UPI003393E5F0